MVNVVYITGRGNDVSDAMSVYHTIKKSSSEALSDPYVEEKGCGYLVMAALLQVS